jgi:hypothetical protein
VDWVITTLGGLLVLVVLRDIFHTLFHPSGRGSLSWHVMRAVWRASRGLRRLGLLSGPLALLAAIGTWTGLLVLGWTLIYWRHLPESFSYASGLNPAARSELLDALYLSLVTGATLGYGDISPTAPWLRLVAPLEALVGFALLTAAVTWVLQVYPALGRRRTLALRLASLRRTADPTAVASQDSTVPAGLFEDLAGQLAHVRVDLNQYSETYFFRDGSADLALPVALGHLGALCRAGHQAPRPDVRLAAAHLQVTLDDLARFLDEQFLHVGGEVEEVVEAYARDHGCRHPPPAGDGPDRP